jgi:hypothetical protein
MFKKYRRNEDILVIKWDGTETVYKAIYAQVKETLPNSSIGIGGTTIGIDANKEDEKLSISLPINQYVVFDIYESVPIKSFTFDQLNRFYTPIDIVFENDGLEYRGYGIIPYNVKPIQAGIQYSHSIVEYVLENFNTKAFRLWGKLHKTAVLLNGGTSNHSENRYSEEEYIGTMEQHLKMLKDNDVTFSTFYEPDLNDMLSCIFLITDERTFNIKKYPDYGMKYNLESKTFEKLSFWTPGIKPTEDWIESIGGKKNYFIREYLRKMQSWN